MIQFHIGLRVTGPVLPAGGGGLGESGQDPGPADGRADREEPAALHQHHHPVRSR